jgi:hypothetical protein
MGAGRIVNLSDGRASAMAHAPVGNIAYGPWGGRRGAASGARRPAYSGGGMGRAWRGAYPGE